MECSDDCRERLSRCCSRMVSSEGGGGGGGKRRGCEWSALMTAGSA